MTDLEIKELWEEIEELRNKLHDIASKKGINSPEAIRASQLLDYRMNDYYRLKR